MVSAKLRELPTLRAPGIQELVNETEASLPDTDRHIMMPFAAGNGVWRLVGAMILIALVTLILDRRARR